MNLMPKPRGLVKHVTCHHCGTALTIGVVLERRTCPNCGKAFLLKGDKPKKLDP